MGNFEFDGHKYKEASTHQKEWGTKIISGLSFIGTESVLDLGCGDGVLTKQLSMLVQNGKVLGIDASAGMIKTAKELEGTNLSFACQDINEIKFNNEFDVIFSNAALHWIKDHNKLIDNCLKALRLNGLIRFNFAGDGNCANFYDVIRQVINVSDYSEYFKTFEWPWYMPRIDEYTKLMNQYIFKELNIWEENADRYFKNADEMIKWIDQPSIVPFLGLIPEEKKKGFRNEVINQMVRKTIQPDGTCFETFRRVNLMARK